MTIFESASKPNAAYREWDPRYPEVVRCLQSDLAGGPSGASIEHVGSTAVPGCGGKGVIDLLALYPDAAGALEDVKAWLLRLGVARQGMEFSRPWPESRPMYLGRYRCLGEAFLVYIHVVARSSDEVRRFREFRELLQSTPDLVTEYCRVKREILAAGITDTDEYAVHKRPFLRGALGSRHALLEGDV